MKIGICDDDVIWCRNAERIINEYGKKTGMEMEVFCFVTQEEINSYEGIPLDVLFMDIILESDREESGADGIRLAYVINKRWKGCQIVYLTNYLYYATEVYHTEHAFFALKEQFEARIGEIFGKVLHELAQNRDRLIFSVIKGKEVSLAPSDIICFERSGRTTNIITVHGTYPIWDKLSAVMERLPEPDFVRCHNSYIVYLPAVREMLQDSFILNDGRKIMISRSYRKSVKMSFIRWALTQVS